MLLVAGVVALVLAATVSDDVATPVLGPAGLALLAASGVARTVRAYRAGDRGRFPTAVGRLRADRALRWRMGVTLALAVGIPAAAAIAAVALIEDGWLWVTFAVMFGAGGSGVARSVRRRAHGRAGPPPAELEEALTRLCMRADMPVPELRVEPSAVPIAWTAGGLVHVSDSLFRALDRAQLDAVLAHELAHLAHRDAVVMDLATAPSRFLLELVDTFVNPANVRAASPREKLGLLLFGPFYVPPAFVLGWLSRLLGLGLSRAREHAADAAAGILTGRPSALASALLVLDAAQPGIPRRDLRELEGHSALCIVEVSASRLGRLLRTHPPTAERVTRLERMEERLAGR